MTVPLSNDDVLEDTEFFFGNLISSDSAVELAPSEARVNIIDLNDGKEGKLACFISGLIALIMYECWNI